MKVDRLKERSQQVKNQIVLQIVDEVLKILHAGLQIKHSGR